MLGTVRLSSPHAPSWVQPLAGGMLYNDKTLGVNAAYPIPWEHMKSMMIEKFRPKRKIPKVKKEPRHLAAERTSLPAYARPCVSMATIYPTMIKLESQEIKKYAQRPTPTTQTNTYQEGRALAFYKKTLTEHIDLK